jgi:hypothetical protein
VQSSRQGLPASSRKESILLIEHDLLYGFKLVQTIVAKIRYEAFVAREHNEAQDYLRILTPS